MINTKMPAPLALTPEEHRLLTAYRKMDDATRGDVLDCCELHAVRRPRHSPPLLRLASGGAK